VAPDPRVVDATERWFLKRGLPHFISGYSAARDIWTRAVPLLTALFVLELFLAFKVGWPIWLDVLAVAGAFGIALLALVLVNRSRGRRPFQRPKDLGPGEIAVFVLVPAIVPVIFGAQLRQAFVIAFGNLLLLGVIYATTSYGLLPMTRWGFGQLGREVGAVFGLFFRALPMLILVLALLLFTTEVWQTASELNATKLTIVVLFFMAIGLAFAGIRLPLQISELATFESWARTEERCAGTPIEPVVADVPEPPDGTPPLTRRQWGNVGLVVLVSEAIQVALVTLMVFLFFLFFGVLTLSQGVIYSWVGRRLEVIHRWKISGDTYVLTEELVKVAIFLAAFSGLYFVVVLLTDAVYRREFLDRVVGQVRDSFAVRAVYLAYLSRR
jgi:hypothetical protein